MTMLSRWNVKSRTGTAWQGKTKGMTPREQFGGFGGWAYLATHQQNPGVGTGWWSWEGTTLDMVISGVCDTWGGDAQ